MFLSKRTVIGRGLKIIGSVQAEGSVKVKGRIEGDLHCSSAFVARNGCVAGPIKASRVVIDGKVDGSIYSAAVVLRSRADVVGNIECKSLVIDKGALVDGRLVFARKESLEAKTDGKRNKANGVTTLEDVSAGKVSREKEKRQLASRSIDLVTEARHLSKNPNKAPA
jgi:cytoskeletal protein CcmA (bactofilin family)